MDLPLNIVFLHVINMLPKPLCLIQTLAVGAYYNLL